MEVLSFIFFLLVYHNEIISASHDFLLIKHDDTERRLLWIMRKCREITREVVKQNIFPSLPFSFNFCCVLHLSGGYVGTQQKSNKKERKGGDVGSREWSKKGRKKRRRKRFTLILNARFRC